MGIVLVWCGMLAQLFYALMQIPPYVFLHQEQEANIVFFCWKHHIVKKKKVDSNTHTAIMLYTVHCCNICIWVMKFDIIGVM